MSKHNFVKKHFKKPMCCHYCNSFIWGMGKTGYRCVDCLYSVHTKCVDLVKADCKRAKGSHKSAAPAAATKKHHITNDTPIHADATIYDKGRLEEHVKVGKLISKDGSVGIYECTDKQTNMKLTLTSYETAKVPNLSTLQRSIQIQRDLKHHHILKLKYAFKSANHVYMVTEACAGEELFEKIQASGAQSEADCQNIIRQLCEAVHYLHENNVAHRNLKPENILWMGGQDGSHTIKVTGFGSANVVAADNMLQTVAGTPDYVAPEILRGEPYNESVDIWAIGVVTYILLCGYPPFYAKDLPSLYKLILSATVSFDETHWGDVSDTAKNFILSCLVLDSEQRFSAAECLSHPWLDPNLVVSTDGPNHDAGRHLAGYMQHRKNGKAEPYHPGDDSSGTNSEPDPNCKQSGPQEGDFTKGKTADFYDIGDQLGSGGCAIVYKCVEKSTGMTWALKRLIKADIDAVRLSREISIMKQLRHPSILRMKEAFDSYEHIDLIMQLADGGELFDKIIAKGHFSEQEAAVTVCQMLEGLRYLHRKSIAHRDLKPENILVAGEDIKIADFGLSNIQGTNSRLRTPCGTPDYVAPEVLANKGYTLACDVWSAGVIAFIILCGHPPFWDTTRAGLYRKITAGQYDFSYPEWAGVSDTAKDFIRHLMEIDPKKRYTAEQALVHPWLADARQAWLEARNERRLLTQLASLSNLAEYNSKLHDASEFKRTPAGEAAFGGGRPVKKKAEYAPGTAKDQYTVGKELGRGGCGVVFKCTDMRSGESFALKRILKKDFETVKLERELAIMQSLEHPRILKLVKAFDDVESVDLIIELAAGGELFDRIIERGHFSEQEAAHVIRQLTEGVGYLHSLGIAHRDLKPENVLLVSKDSYDIKIADFGLSNILDDTGAKLATACGTPDYVAPEVLKGEGYNQAVDMWAIGVLTYILLCGYPPFYDKVQAKLFQKIMSVTYKFHETEWKDISVQAKDFIRRLLVEQPTLRNSAHQSLRHKWLQVNAPTSNNQSANPKNLRSLPTTHHLEVYRRARKRADDSSSMDSAHSTSGTGSTGGTASPSSGRRAIHSSKAQKGLAHKVISHKMGKPNQTKRDKSYQMIMHGSKHAPKELPDGYELIYSLEWESKLLEFIKLERKYHSTRGNRDWVYEMAFSCEDLRFRVRGSADVKRFIAGVLQHVGKL